MGLSASALPLLQRLQRAGQLQQIALSSGAAAALPSCPDDVLQGNASTLLREHWQGSLLVVGAIGAVTRLIAPLISDKQHDPAVLVLDAEARLVVPLLGGHQAGGEAMARELAALLGATAVITGDCATQQRLAWDQFGSAWGWTPSGEPNDWKSLMVAQAQNQGLSVQQTCGNQHWRQAQGAEASLISPKAGLHKLSITAERPSSSSPTPCRWHPPVLWIGVGCERNTSLNLLTRAMTEAIAEAGLAPQAVAGLSTIDRKGDETALLQLAEQRHWPLHLHTADDLATIPVPTPSDVVQSEMGTASVAEAAALRAAGPEGALRQTKRIYKAGEPGEQGAVTVAIAEAQEAFAPQRGELHLIGSGPGDLSLLTPDARGALSRCVAWVGYGLYLDLLEPLRRPDQIRLDGQLTRERDRCLQALQLARQGARVALVSSGDSGIYGMAGLALELWLSLPEQARPRFEVHPGISALQLAAARAGAPLMHDFCTISLSDRLTPWEVIEKRLEAAAAGDFVVALYNPRSKGRDWQLERARQILLSGRPSTTPVVVARQLGRSEEAVELQELGSLPVESVDMLTVLVIGNSSSRASGGKLVTPRGYPGAELS